MPTVHPFPEMCKFINKHCSGTFEDKLLEEAKANFVEIDLSQLPDDFPADLDGKRIGSIKHDEINNVWILIFPSLESLQKFFEKENVGNTELPALDRKFVSPHPIGIHRNVSFMEVLERRKVWKFWTFLKWQPIRPGITLADLDRLFGPPIPPKFSKKKGCQVCGLTKCAHSTYNDGHYSLKVCSHCHEVGHHWSAKCPQKPEKRWSSSEICSGRNCDECNAALKSVECDSPNIDESNSLNTDDDDSVVTCDLPHPVCAMAFAPPDSYRHHIAVGSFLTNFSNRVDIFDFNSKSLSLKPNPLLSFDHPYPPTKLMFDPSSIGFLASSSDSLRLWDLSSQNQNSPISTLSNYKTPYPSALYSFDWNEFESHRVGTSGMGCTIWDIENSVMEDHRYPSNALVHDIAWHGPLTYASASADGTIRITDLREGCSDISFYNSPHNTPLLRLAWNKQDLNYMATTMLNRNIIVILDMRFPGVPVGWVEKHKGSVNAIAWAPHNSRHICSGGVDAQVVIWEPFENQPVSMHGVEKEIYQLQWCAGLPDWIGVAFGNKMQLLKVKV